MNNQLTTAFQNSIYLAIIGFLFSCAPDEIYLKPVIETAQMSVVTETTAITGGLISSDEGNIVAARGVCWSITPNPTINDNKTLDAAGTGYFISHLTGLNPSTTYFLRAYATNKAGTAYGLQVSFTTKLSKIQDIDGNEYGTIQIGDQLWLASNLKTTKYRNGDPIVNMTDFTIWQTLTTGAFIDYDNDPSNGVIYGHLYNWFAVNDSRKLAPVGWHVATDAEWEELVNYLGGANVAGGKLKETGDHHWFYPNFGATNDSGFNALPGGFSNSRGWNINVYGYWWSSTDYNATQAWYRYMHYDEEYIGRTVNNTKNMGLSVRCIKD